MADYSFEFKTENPYIIGRVAYSVTDPEAQSDGSLLYSQHKVSYVVELRRTNSYNGSPTNGRMNCYVYSNGSSNQVGYKEHQTFPYFTVPNNNTWAEAIRGEYTVNNVLAFQAGTFSIGVKLTGTQTGQQANYQEDEYDVKAYRTAPGAASLTLKDLKNNTFEIETTRGSNGINNPSTHCQVLGTIDGSVPGGANFGFSYVTHPDDAVTVSRTFDLALVNTQKIPLQNIGPNSSIYALKINKKSTRLYGYPITVDKYNQGNGDGERKYIDVYFYEPPEWTEVPQISPVGNKPTYKAKYKVDWTSKVTAKNKTSPYKYNIYKYMVYLYVNDDTNPVELTPSGVTATSCEFSGEGYNLKKDDKIKVKVVAYDRYGNGADLTAESGFSNEITIKSSGVMNIMISDKKWVEGQAYIKTDKGWKEATSVHINTANGWKESI